MSNLTSEFPLFSKLPAELRDQVWQYCLPHRFCELDQLVDNILYFETDNENDPRPCKLHYTTYMNGRPPVISRVCHESRCVALKAGEFEEDTDSEWPAEAQWRHQHRLGSAWQHWRDRTRDAVHLNWEPVCDIDWGPGSGRALHCLAWDASHGSAGGSMMPGCLIPSFDSVYLDDSDEDYVPEGTTPPDFVERPLSPKTLSDFEAIQRLSKWMVVMRVVVVHSALKAAAMTGLFGLLGDARVQIVDVSDEAKVEAYFYLAETCERQAAITIGQDFRRESPDSIHTWERRLKRGLEAHFRPEKITAVIRPAIMFRLCTQMCNHITVLDGGTNSPQESVIIAGEVT